MKKHLFLLLPILMLFSFSNNNLGNQRAFYECSKPMDVDTITQKARLGEVYFRFIIDKEPKNLKSLNFTWLEDNPTGYFIAELINMSDSTFSVPKQDGSLMMIQEALDERGSWIPIEYWVYSGCGNSYFNPLMLDSGKCVMIPIKKYEGNFKTKMRLKLKTKISIFYSASFDGSIDKSLFKKEKQNVEGILYNGPASYFDEKE